MSFFSALPPEMDPKSKLEQVVIWLGKLRADLLRLPDWSFVTAIKESGLVASRRLKAGANVTITDGGPGGDITIASTGGGGGGAPINASYVTAVTEPALTQSRLLTAGTNVTIVDGGALGPITVSATGGGTTSPLTTKGDIWGFDTADNRIPVGQDGFALSANSATALGVTYRTIFSPLIWLFGTGSDGTIAFNGTNTFAFASLAGSTYTLTRNIFGTNITLSAGITVYANNFGIWANGTLTVPSTALIHSNGPNGSSTGTAGASVPFNFYCGQSGSGGAGNIGGGSFGSNNSHALGGTGGRGGNGSGTGGAVGGNITPPAVNNGGVETPINLVLVSMVGLEQGFTSAGLRYNGGAGGGGAGGDNVSNKGGGGGSGGGYVGICAFLNSGTGSITATGGNGGSPGIVGCGGGGGGGGGYLFFLTTTTAPTFTFSVAGGAGGTGGGGGGITGSNGVAGNSTVIALT